MKSILYQHMFAEAGPVLYCTEEVNFIVISLDSVDLGVVPIAVEPDMSKKSSMVEAAVKMSRLPIVEIIGLASALKVVSEVQAHQVELKNGDKPH